MSNETRRSAIPATIGLKYSIVASSRIKALGESTMQEAAKEAAKGRFPKQYAKGEPAKMDFGAKGSIGSRINTTANGVNAVSVAISIVVDARNFGTETLMFNDRTGEGNFAVGVYPTGFLGLGKGRFVKIYEDGREVEITRRDYDIYRRRAKMWEEEFYRLRKEWKKQCPVMA